MTITTPVCDDVIDQLKVGDEVLISGYIYCGRDAVLPKLSRELLMAKNITLEGGVIFHTAVSCAGVGPTSSNKKEIENSFEPLAIAGVKLFIGKGAIKTKTVDLLAHYHSVFAVMPPVTALLRSKTLEQKVIAFEEEGMEAFYRLKVIDYPVIIAAAHGQTIYV